MQKGNFEDTKGVFGQTMQWPNTKDFWEILYNYKEQYKLYSNGKWYLPLLILEINFLWTAWNEMFNNSVLSIKHFYVLTRTVV